MPSIKIENLGPIKECEMEIDDFTVLTGCQASGKSTIAKAIYFCRTVKDDILDEIIKFKDRINEKEKFRKSFTNRLRSEFTRLFGSPQNIIKNFKLNYYYDRDHGKSVTVEFSESEFGKYYFVKLSSRLFAGVMSIFEKSGEKDKNEIKRELCFCFEDEYDAVFIPAGRNVTTLLTSQLSYILASMDDEQKNAIDYCSLKFIEYIIKIKPLFSSGIHGLKKILYPNDRVSFSKYEEKLEEFILKILNGNYVFANGEERLYLDDERYVKINFTSSGQQETVWLFNILFYLVANHTKAFIILEEPEAHLYPDAQKVTSEILALMSNCDCQMFITTHSPYILGAINNLIYAEHIASNSDKATEVNEIVNEMLRIEKVSAYKVDNGTINSCIEDTPEKLIINEVIDGASEEVNDVYDKLFDIANDLNGGN